MTDERSRVSITSEVNEKIKKEKSWLEFQGLKIQATISFGSAQWGPIKPKISDVDVFFLFTNDTRPSNKELVPNNDGVPGFRFVSSVEFEKGFPVNTLESHCFSPSRVIAILDRFLNELNSTTSPKEIVSEKEKGQVKQMTHHEFIRGLSWIYQVFKLGKVMDGEIPVAIAEKIKEVDVAYAKYMSQVKT